MVPRQLRAEDHVGLVVSIAKRHKGKADRFGIDFEELMQEGMIGVIDALKRFDVNRGVKFSTYASWWIHHHIARHIENHAYAIRMPVKVFQTKARAGELPPRPVSLDKTLPDGVQTVNDLLVDQESESPEEYVARKEEKETLWAAIEKLEPRERAILKMRYRLEMTLEEVGSRLGHLSRERIRQIEADALKQLRQYLKGKLR